MKGQEIISHITQAKMPDREYIREKCKRQAMDSSKTQQRSFWLKAGAAAACLLFVSAITLTLISNFGNGTTGSASSDGFSVLIYDENIAYDDDLNLLTTSVSYIDSRPSLRFFITGEDIAKIEVSTSNEYLKVHDSTQQLDEIFWNPELYYEETEVNGEIHKYVPVRSLLQKSHVIIFPEEFADYDMVWYDWLAWNLHEWASEDNYSRFQGYNGISVNELEELLDSMSDEERLTVAAGGGNTSATGHILLDGYPDDLLNDRILIKITDIQGFTESTEIIITVSNNALGQTVVTASVES